MNVCAAVTRINGAFGDAICVRDRGFLYGDGVFRTLTRRHGALQQFERHYAKLAADSARLGLPVISSATWLEDLAALPEQDGVLRMILTRGEGPRGYAVPAASTPTRLVSWDAMPSFPQPYRDSGVAMRVCDLRLSHQPVLAGVKHMNRLENVLARRELLGDRYQEGLLLDYHGNVVEGISSNVFLMKDRSLITPNLAHCGVAGVQRDRVIAFAKADTLDIEIREVHLDEVYDADSVFVTNSVIGVWQIAQLEACRWSPHPWISRLRTYLESND